MTDTAALRIATRMSQLALWQAEHVKGLLLRAHPDLRIELVPLTTLGDRVLDKPLAKIGGKGLFIKELETALLERRADLAVHSMKDVPMALPDGLVIGALLQREDPRDALVSTRFADLSALPAGARVGTSSLRRQCQLRVLRPDLELLDLRGNVNTRLRKLDEGAFDAIVLAAAGLIRLNLEHRIACHLAPEQLLPAVGQGVIGVELRAGDTTMKTLLESLHDIDSAECVAAERALNVRLQGGCEVPIAGFAQLLDGSRLRLRALVGSADGREVLHDEIIGSRHAAEDLGVALAERLLARGADRILAVVPRRS